tara:strand:- start:1272 stop:2669 length:1398 start_codon:yes stop_codon:yes gene_type:complete
MKRILFLLFFPIISFCQNPNYSEDIAPIIYGKCLQCHHSNGIAPLTLETYSSTVSNAGIIQHVTSSGEMPPWPPDTTFRRYSYENTLSFDEINTITTWISNGVPLGDTLLLPSMPTFNNSSQLGTPDLEIQIPTYSSTAGTNNDDYVCFSIPTGLTQNREIRAVEVIPGNLQTVHHVIVSLDPFPNSSIVTTPNCMGPQGGTIYTWAPGTVPLVFPTSTNNAFGSNLPANSSLSLAMHYPEGSFGQLDSTKVKIYFYPLNTNIREVSSDFLINEGIFGAPFILPANQITEITGTYGPTVQDYSFMSVFPHMHLLGKSIEMYAVTPTNDTINLVRINNWDFEWQGAYLFEKFIKIPAGSIIYGNGIYDNTQSTSNPNPVTVQSGLNTQDEMFIGIFQYLPYQTGDENISIDAGLISTNNNNLNTNYLSRNLLKITNYLGQSVRPTSNTPLFFIYDDGKVEKRVILE